jgi:hypothetical protein
MSKTFPSDLADEILLSSTIGDANMALITAGIRERLLDNGRKQSPVGGTSNEIDFRLGVKLFTPDANCT